MDKMVKEVSKDLYINAQHYSNPFAQESAQFYVRLVEIRDGWVAYATWNNHVKFMEFSEFFKVFLRPYKIYGIVCHTFSDSLMLYCGNYKGTIYKNPWVLDKTQENYRGIEFIQKYKY